MTVGNGDDCGGPLPPCVLCGAPHTRPQFTENGETLEYVGGPPIVAHVTDRAVPVGHGAGKTETTLTMPTQAVEAIETLERVKDELCEIEPGTYLKPIEVQHLERAQAILWPDE